MVRSQRSRARLRGMTSLWALLFSAVLLPKAAGAHDNAPAVQLPIIPPPTPLDEPELSSEPYEFVSDGHTLLIQSYGSLALVSPPYIPPRSVPTSRATRQTRCPPQHPLVDIVRGWHRTWTYYQRRPLDSLIISHHDTTSSRPTAICHRSALVRCPILRRRNNVIAGGLGDGHTCGPECYGQEDGIDLCANDGK